MNIQWYPGHMTKAKRAMKEDMKLIDLVIELVDARVPLASRNPDLDELGKGKARVVLLNKADLADQRMNEAWTRYFQEQGFLVLKVNARSGSGLKQLNGVVQEACREKIERDRKRGILNRPVRAMVVGIPNVGKSTFINSFAGKACTKTGNKPGVTKGNQWIRLNRTLELLDTPGILWPKFEDQQTGLLLALIGSINDEILNREELAMELVRLLAEHYPQELKNRYPVEALEGEDRANGISMAQAAGILEQIARLRGCLQKGGDTDTAKAASMVLDDFRSGKLGRITLERRECHGAENDRREA
ncbi:MAG: ribosome biogenesis GTPase YlqF [Lachnospiraceae bacterium]|nr:ribosome biogenesis GTPase YlqF [Lachnospiraceae bacterium]MCI8957803.1 ribosome biogenesis GTPase YlqF [Lachnospiraceae bacterium]